MDPRPDHAMPATLLTVACSDGFSVAYSAAAVSTTPRNEVTEPQNMGKKPTYTAYTDTQAQG